MSQKSLAIEASTSSHSGENDKVTAGLSKLAAALKSPHQLTEQQKKTADEYRKTAGNDKLAALEKHLYEREKGGKSKKRFRKNKSKKNKKRKSKRRKYN